MNPHLKMIKFVLCQGQAIRSVPVHLKFFSLSAVVMLNLVILTDVDSAEINSPLKLRVLWWWQYH